MSDIHNILKQYWGYDQFRPLQEDIIRSVLNGEDTLALLPTGGGKSICFQVPAMATEGICIVVSPLIALMKDQVENLKSKDIPALAIYSGMSFRQIDLELDRCIQGQYKFLYVSPERLKTEIFLARFKQMKVNLLAIDEAHCISQWGYDFRPEYLQIAEIRQWTKAPVLALTATATAVVVEDIQNRMAFIKKKVFRKSFERKNLNYIVLQEEDKLGRLLQLCKHFKGTGVIYARNRRLCRDIAEYLSQHGQSADYYHAGLDQASRNRKQEAWIQNKIRIIVSTNAFGMGIDKPDVRFVLHYEMPDSLEAYYQEAGRAGRDEKEAYCISLIHSKDKITAFDKLEASYPGYQEVSAVYEQLCNYYRIAVNSGFMKEVVFNLAEFSVAIGKSSIQVFNALKVLEQQDIISLSDAIHQPAQLHILVNNTVLYDFELRNKHIAAPMKLLLRTYGGLFEQYVKIDEKYLAGKLNTTPEVIITLFEKLKAHEILDYIPARDQPTLTFLQIRENKLSYDQQAVKNRKELAMNRLKAVYDYAENPTECRSQILLRYFDESNAPKCGQCDVCRKEKKEELSESEYRDWLEQKIKSDIRDLKELLSSLGHAHTNGLKTALQHLIDENRVHIDDKQQLHWQKEN